MYVLVTTRADGVCSKFSNILGATFGWLAGLKPTLLLPLPNSHLNLALVDEPTSVEDISVNSILSPTQLFLNEKSTTGMSPTFTGMTLGPGVVVWGPLNTIGIDGQPTSEIMLSDTL